MAKKKILKTLLTTASGLAVVTCLAGDALGVVGTNRSRPNRDDADLDHLDGVATHFNNGVLGLDAVFTDTTAIINARTDDASGADLELTANAVDIRGFNCYGNDTEIQVVGADLTLGAVNNDISANVTLSVAAINAANTGAGADGVNASLTVKLGDNDATLILTGKAVATDGKSPFVVNDYSGLGEIDYNSKDSTVQVDGAAGALTLNSTFSNAADGGTLDLVTSLKATSGSVLSIKTIDIDSGGAGGEGLTVAPAISYSAPITFTRQQVSTDILSAAGGHAITLGDADSEFTLESVGGADNKFILQNDLDSGGANTGVILLKATGNDGQGNNSALSLVVADPAVGKDFGDDGAAAGNELKSITFTGDANSSITVGHGIQVGDVQTVTVTNGATEVQDMSFAGVKTIALAAAGSKLTINATAAIDIAAGATTVNLNTKGGGAITFGNAASRLVLKTASLIGGGGKDAKLTFAIANDIDPGNHDRGVLEINNSTAGNGLIVVKGAGGAKSIGGTKRFKAVEITGSKPVIFDSTAGTGIAVNRVADLNIKGGATLIFGNNANAIDANGDHAVGNAAISIGTLGGVGNPLNAGTLILDVQPANIVFAPAKYYLESNDSVLQFGYTAQTGLAAKTVTLGGNFDPANAGQGILVFDHVAGSTQFLKVTATQRLGQAGVAANRWKEIETRGTVVFDSAAGTALTDVGTQTLRVSSGSLSIGIPGAMGRDHIIGTTLPNTAATLNFDLVNGNHVMANDGTTTFLHADSVLGLNRQNVGAAASKITVSRDIAPGPGDDNSGIVSIQNNRAAQEHKIDTPAPGNNKKIGVDPTHRIKELRFLASPANTSTTVVDIPVFAKKISVPGIANITISKPLVAGDGGTMTLAVADSKVTLTGAGHSIEKTTLSNPTARLTIGAAGDLTGNVIANAGGDGELHFVGAIGTITGNVGTAATTTPVVAAKALKEIKFNGTGAVLIDGTVDATLIQNVDNTLGNTVTITGNITGGYDFNNKDQVVFTFKGAKFDGTIDSTVGAGGTLVFQGATDAEVTGKIGDTNELTAVHINTPKKVTLKDEASSDLYKFLAAGTLRAEAAIDATGDGDIDFNGQAGTFVFADGVNATTIDGDASNTTGPAGTVTFEGSHNVEGRVGQTKLINRIELTKAAGGGVVDFQNQLRVNTLDLGANQAKFTGTAGGNYEVNQVRSVGAGNLFIQETLIFDNNIAANGPATFGLANAPISEIRIDGNRNVTFNNAHIFAKVFKPTTDGHGWIKFKGLDNRLSVDTINPATGPNIGKFEVGNGGLAKLTIDSDLRLKDQIIIHGNSEVIIGANAKNIVVGTNALAGDGFLPGAAQVAGEGIVRFQNSSPVTVTGNFGSNALPNTNIKELIFENNKVTLTSNILNVKQFTFNNSGDGVTLDLGNTVLNNLNFVNKTTHTNTIITGASQTFTNSFGTAQNPIGNICMRGTGQTINIDTINFFGGITSLPTNAGTVNVNAAQSQLGDIGRSDSFIQTVNFKANTTVTGSIFASNSNVAKGKVLTIQGMLDTSQLTLQGAGATANIPAASVIDFDIRSTAGNTGIINVQGGRNLVRPIGQSSNRLGTLNFTPGSSEKVKFTNAPLFSQLVNFDNGTYELGSNLDIDGGLTATGSTFNLGSNVLNLRNGNSAFVGDIQFNTTLNGSALGRVIANPGTAAQVQFTNLDKLTITVDDSSTPIFAPVETFDFLSLTSGAIAGIDTTEVKITNKPTNLSRWDILPGSDGQLQLRRTNTTSSGIKNIAQVTGFGKDIIPDSAADFLQNVDANSPAAGFVTQLNAMTTKNQGDALARILTPDQATQQVLGDMLNNVTTVANNRLTSFNSPVIAASFISSPTPVAPSLSTPSVSTPSGSGGTIIPTSQESSSRQVSDETSIISGIGAGEKANKYGVWFSPFYDDAHQKMRSGTTGYHAQTAGGSLGFDVLANDDMIVGAAVTYVNTNVKHKDFKRGDKSKINSVMGTFYGLYQLNNQYYVQGSITFGTSDVTNSEKRRTNNAGFGTAKSKYTSMSLGSEVIGGYNHPLNNTIVLTPQIGFGVAKVNDASYKEKGVPGQNLEINKKSAAKVNLILGLRATTVPFYCNEVAITPEVHVLVRHDLRGDQAKIEAILDRGVPGQTNVISKKAPKTNKTYYNAGFGVNFGYSDFEYGIGYDANVATKYVGHQGILKIRVNF